MHFVIGKPQHTIVLLLVEPGCSLRVIVNLLGVRVPVNLNHQFRFGAEEIHDVRGRGVLSSAPGGPPVLRAGHGQLCAIDLSIAQSCPQFFLGGRQFVAQLFGPRLHF